MPEGRSPHPPSQLFAAARGRQVGSGATATLGGRVMGPSPQVILPLALSLSHCPGAERPELWSPATWLGDTGSPALPSKPSQHRVGTRQCHLKHEPDTRRQGSFSSHKTSLLTHLAGGPSSLPNQNQARAPQSFWEPRALRFTG